MSPFTINKMQNDKYVLISKYTSEENVLKQKVQTVCNLTLGEGGDKFL